jgi:hypothetical protein
MTFDMAFVTRPTTDPFFNPMDEIEIDNLISLKPLAKKFFEFEAPTDITWAWELEPAMIFEMDC